MGPSPVFCLSVKNSRTIICSLIGAKRSFVKGYCSEVDMGFFGNIFGRSLSPDVRAGAKAAISKGARIIDVRTPDEFSSGHVANAINIPLQYIPSSLSKVGKPTRPVVLYCRSGSRSSAAKRMLESNGFTAVFDMGAISNWPL